MQCPYHLPDGGIDYFFYLVHESIDIYVDVFRTYGNSFQEALSNLCKVLKICIEMNLPSSPETLQFFMNEGIILGNLLSKDGIQVDPKKIAIIRKVLVP